MTRVGILVGALTVVACGPKGGETNSAVEAPPPVGWYQASGAMGECYNPPNFEAIEQERGIVGRRSERANTLDALLSQWNGSRGDGVSFPEGSISDVETILLSDPADIETVAAANFEHCMEAMAVGGSDTAWRQWFTTLPETLTAGECYDSLLDRMFHYIDLGSAWYWQVPMCEGDRLSISASTTDRFRLSAGGEWLTLDGDPNGVVDESYPCSAPGCLPGMLVGKFESSNGHVEYFPIGAAAEYRAPFRGTLSVGVNDNTWNDNTWFSNGGVVDRASIEIGPAD